ncbi:CocE/NonD family hydrolase [Mycobacterium sp.]|uniref:CocE/NonD family hydrolase n=1 Tax=Mycobacterium sp. TaxID=1785 RepID=UPI003F9C2BCE
MRSADDLTATSVLTEEFEVRDGMRIWFDAPITMDDGIVLRADVFRSDTDEPAPVIMAMGPYGKGRRFQDEPYTYKWTNLVAQHPELTEASDCAYLTWETVDPQLWTAAGYAVVRVDSRGAGASPGHLSVFAQREALDYYQAIEWAGGQPWCTGKVGLCGISYHAINQWQVAALQPPSLAAICPWEGAVDYYRDMTHHGGIASNVFYQFWYPLQVLSNQHGLGTAGPVNPWTGKLATGDDTLTEQELAARRTDPLVEFLAHPFDDELYTARTPDLTKITVPLLSAANWFGQGLHSRGNFEGFAGAASAAKWLEIHPGRHEEWFCLPNSVAMQMRFFDHFLKGETNGFADTPRVLMHIPNPDGTSTPRTADGWPPSDTIWQELHLTADRSLRPTATPTQTGTVSFDGFTGSADFTTAPFETDTDIVGPLAARLHVSTTAAEADLFLTVRLFDPDGAEVTFDGSVAPAQPLTNGWLRLSHRTLDPGRSLPYRPWYPHDRKEQVLPNEIYPVQVEIWPVGIHVPAGYRLGLTVGATDFIRPGEAPGQSTVFLHNDPTDRPADRYAGTLTIHFGAGHDNVMLVPFLPAEPAR